jgi:hypothetical protein
MKEKIYIYYKACRHIHIDAFHEKQRDAKKLKYSLKLYFKS